MVTMPPEAIQRSWTGSSGEPLMAQTVAFVRALENGFRTFTGRELAGKAILDYGCGWGRHLRLMLGFTPPELLFGCDPWDESIALCKRYDVLANLALCDYVPKSIPFPGKRFDLIYAYSVFTHLSEKTSKAVLGALRDAIAQEGLLVITVRDGSYWAAHDQGQSVVDVAAMQAEHERRGFAFTTHIRPPIDGDVPFGDTSISLEYMGREWLSWRVQASEVFKADPQQRLVFLRPA